LILIFTLVEYKKTQRLLNKAQALRCAENKAKEKLQEKLDGLLQIRELEDPGDYRDYIEAEINHLKKILPDSDDIKKL